MLKPKQKNPHVTMITIASVVLTNFRKKELNFLFINI